jgi:SAM-dependent methyltransferase
MKVNFGLTANDYVKFRSGFPDTFFERVFADGYIKPQASLLDLGTGTGTLARGFASRGCLVTGVDRSDQMIAQARALSQQQGLNIEFHVASAEATGLPDSSFDIVTAGQCWHWFDRPKAAQEVKRLLKPNGTIIIAHFDWLPLPDNIVDLTEKLVIKFNPAWAKFAGGLGIYPQWLMDLGEAGFQEIVTFSFDMDVPYTFDAWRGRIRASSGVGASMSDEDVSRFDSELGQLLEEKYQASAGSETVLKVPHRIFAVIAHSPSL